MRLLIATFSIILGLTQPGLPQNAPLAGTTSPLQGVPTLAPLIKNITPSVVNIAIKGRVAQEPLSFPPSKFHTAQDKR
jgi:hypothetical protein